MKLRWLILLLFIFCALPAQAVNNPIPSQDCGNGAANGNFGYNPQFCFLAGINTGDVIIIRVAQISQTNPTGTDFTGTTEAPTCPSGSTSNAPGAGGFSGWNLNTKICYVVVASPHTSFLIQALATGTSHRESTLLATVYPNGSLGAVDSSSATHANNALSLSVTTAGSNEIIFMYCTDFSVGLVAGANTSQSSMFATTDIVVGNQEWRGFGGYRIAATANTYSVACTSTTSLPYTAIAGLAFSISSPAAPTIYQYTQFCSNDSQAAGGTNSGGCDLSNTVSGNWVVAAFFFKGVSSAPTTAGNWTETGACQTNSWTSHVYGGNTYSLTICYVQTSSGHGTFHVDLDPGVGKNVWGTIAFEIPGLLAVDSGSAAAAAATTVNYTTAANNEWTIGAAIDTFTTTGPTFQFGNSFIPIGWGKNAVGTGSYDQGHYAAANKVTVSSGSNTFSYSLTGSASPLISVLAFTELSQGVPRKRGHWIGE